MEKVTKPHLLTLLLIVCMFALLCLSACNRTYYFEKEGIYLSDSPFIQLDCISKTGSMIIDGTAHQLHLGYAHDGTYIKIYDKDVREQLERDENGYIIDLDAALLWKADTEEKDGKLYLTVTEDNISNYVGKTIVLEFRSYEE